MRTDIICWGMAIFSADDCTIWMKAHRHKLVGQTDRWHPALGLWIYGDGKGGGAAKGHIRSGINRVLSCLRPYTLTEASLKIQLDGIKAVNRNVPDRKQLRRHNVDFGRHCCLQAPFSGQR
jgi:hypothetical protein